MKCLFGANTVTQEGPLHLLKSMLDDAGIACTVRNEYLCIAKGEAPVNQCIPELWLLEDADAAKAEEIMGDWEYAMSEQRVAWRCPRCDETNEGQFTACWKCGNELGETEPQTP